MSNLSEDMEYARLARRNLKQRDQWNSVKRWELQEALDWCVEFIDEIKRLNNILGEFVTSQHYKVGEEIIYEGKPHYIEDAFIDIENGSLVWRYHLKLVGDPDYNPRRWGRLTEELDKENPDHR